MTTLASSAPPSPRARLVRGLLRAAAVLAIVALAFALRQRAVVRLGTDYDEDDYLRAGQQYATALQDGDLGAFTRENYRPEHPPLAKIGYGLALAPLPKVAEIPDRPTTAEPAKDLPPQHLRAARRVGAVLGTLTVALAALLSLAGGAFLALHTFTIKYCSQVQLEALPLLASAVCAVAYERSRAFATSRFGGWLLLSALALGITAASKYPYCIVGLAVLAHWAGARWQARRAGAPAEAARTVRLWLAFGAIAVLVFLVLDPYLWPDPLGRLVGSFGYHFGYAQSEHVKESGLPAWQPLVWLVRSAAGWHPRAFLPGSDLVDLLFTALAVLGLGRLGRERPLYATWIALALAFLLAWPTKWPQYVLLVAFPWSLAAAAGLRTVAEGVRDLARRTWAPVSPDPG